MTRILFVEDDESYRTNMVYILEKAGYEVVAVSSAMEAMEVFLDYDYDLVISDYHMKGMDGVRFLTYVKKVSPEMKTIILTGLGTDDTELAALELEVEQYLDKNLRMDVLLKYIEITLKKEHVYVQESKILTSKVDDIEVNVEKRTVKQRGKPIPLTRKEFDILCYFLSNKGYALSREDIIEHVWDVEVEEVELRAVDSHVKALRKKIQLISIVSIRGFGYKWSE